MTGVVGCRADALSLDDQSKELGIRDLHVYYAAYTPLLTVDRSESLFKLPRIGGVFNNSVASGKLKSSKVLKALEDQFVKAADQLKALEGKEKRKILLHMRGDFACEGEMVSCRLEMLEDLKERALDNLLFMELDSNASFSDFGEAMWIMKNHRPLDYKRIVPMPGSSEISPSGIISVRKSILERRGGKFATGNIFKARSFVLAVFGRIHMETVLEQVIERAKGALKTYMTAIDDVLIYEAMTTASIKEQQNILSRLAQKRSLIGCYPVCLPGDDNQDDDQIDEYIVDYVEEEEEGFERYSTLEEIGMESPIVDSSEIESDDELGDEPEPDPESESEPETEEGTHKNEEPKHGFLRFHWNFDANPSDEVKRYKRYISFIEYCY